jgi:molecular chaperone DnaK
MVFGRLRILAEAVKRELSTRNEYTLVVDDLVPGDRGTAVVWSFRMTRPELEWASLALIERTFKVCQQALDAGGVQPGELDRIVLVGGATGMPMVARKVEQFFGRAPIVRINPDEVVALGAAIQAALLDRARQKTAQPMAHPRIAMESVVEPLPEEEPPSSREVPSLPVIGAALAPATAAPVPPAVPVAPTKTVRLEPPTAAQAPVARTEFLPGRQARELVFDVPGSKAAPPFDVEIAGPPPQPTAHVALPGPPPPPVRPRLPTMPYPFAANASGPPRPAPLLIDVTPLSLGVETVGGFCDMLIQANTPVPCDRTRQFATATDGQTTVQVRVAQGESQRFSENTFLGELELSGIPPAARGESPIAVTFEIDADGILNVRARDAATGRETAARIQLVGGQSDPRELEAMRARQQAHPIAGVEPPVR